MSSKFVGIEDARKRLGDLVTAAQQGTDVILTRNGKPAARLAPITEDTMQQLKPHEFKAGMVVLLDGRPQKITNVEVERRRRIEQDWANSWDVEWAEVVVDYVQHRSEVYDYPVDSPYMGIPVVSES